MDAVEKEQRRFSHKFQFVKHFTNTDTDTFGGDIEYNTPSCINACALQDVMVLLNVIGTEDTRFISWFADTDHLFERLQETGKFRTFALAFPVCPSTDYIIHPVRLCRDYLNPPVCMCRNYLIPPVRLSRDSRIPPVRLSRDSLIPPVRLCRDSLIPPVRLSRDALCPPVGRCRDSLSPPVCL